MPKEVKVHKDKVYYPEGNASRDLYVNRKMSKRQWRTSPRRVAGIDLTAPRICGTQCVAVSESTGRRCRRRTCVDYRYCSQHLAREKHLMVGKSKRLHELGVNGLGLYAYNPELGKLKKDAHGFPVKEMALRVFRKMPPSVKRDKMMDYVIGDYGGEVLTTHEKNARYEDPDDMETAAYAEGGTNFVLDGLSAASAVSYSNESLDVARLMRDSSDQRDFKSRYQAAGARDRASKVQTKQINHMIRMLPTKDIYQGEEILWHYGPGYWGTEGMKRVITGSGW